jgi:hypothetical protein
VAFGSGANTITGENAFTYNSGTNQLQFIGGAGLSFSGTGAPITVIGDTFGTGTALTVNNADGYVGLIFPAFTQGFAPGSFELFGDVVGNPSPSLFVDPSQAALISPDFSSTIALSATNAIALTGNTIALVGSVIAPLNYAASGSPAVSRIAQLRGVDFLGANDDGPGTTDASPPRFFNIYARDATAIAPLGSVSLALSGTWWNGAASVQKGIELGNVINGPEARAEFWMQELTDGTGIPFIRMYRTGLVDGFISSHTDAGDTLNLGAWDVDDAVDKFFIELMANDTPSCTIAPPTGGTVNITANGFIANTSYYEGTEMTAPAAGGANTFRVFAQDNGAGKTQLMVLFNTGVAQQLAVQA